MLLLVERAGLDPHLRRHHRRGGDPLHHDDHAVGQHADHPIVRLGGRRAARARPAPRGLRDDEEAAGDWFMPGAGRWARGFLRGSRGTPPRRGGVGSGGGGCRSVPDRACRSRLPPASRAVANRKLRGSGRSVAQSATRKAEHAAIMGRPPPRRGPPPKTDPEPHGPRGAHGDLPRRCRLRTLPPRPARFRASRHRSSVLVAAVAAPPNRVVPNPAFAWLARLRLRRGPPSQSLRSLLAARGGLRPGKAAVCAPGASRHGRHARVGRNPSDSLNDSGRWAKGGPCQLPPRRPAPLGNQA